MKRRRKALWFAVASSMAAAVSVVPSAAVAADPPDPFFGTWSDGMSLIAQQGNAASVSRLDDVSSAGLGMVRQYIWWDRIETSPGTYEWAVMDELVKEASARGVTILPTFLYTPEFYRPDGTNNITPPTDPQDLANFASAMVKRYGTGGTYWNCVPVVGCQRQPYKPITMWEVWNEPDYPAWWKGAPDPQEYLDLLKPTSTAIKTADPASKVVLGALTNWGGSSSDGYLAQLYDLGAAPYFDILTLNPYAWDVGALMALVKGERAVAAAHGDSATPTLLTEWGWATSGRHPYTAVDEDCQAALTYAGAKALRQRRDELNLIGATQFQWQDASPVSANMSWPNYAGVRRSDGTAKPSRAAYAAAISGQAAPTGATLDACPAERRSLDGVLRKMTVVLDGPGSGTVSSYPSGVSCPGDCSQEWQPNMPVVLTAKPDDHSFVAKWRGAPGCTGTQCTVTMSQARTVRVTFGQVATPGTYEESSPAISYTGTWQTAGDARDSGGSVRFATNGPASAQLVFDGSRVTWFARKAPAGGRARVLVDGVRVATVDLHSSTRRFHVPAFTSGTLSAGRHTLRIEFTGQKAASATDDAVWLDAFVVG